MSGSHAVMGGNAVIHCYNQLRPFAAGLLCHLSAEPVAVLKTVRDKKIHLPESHPAQCADRQCGAGCAVSIKIADNHNPLILVQCFFQQYNGLINAIKLTVIKQPACTALQLLRRGNSSGSIQTA